MVYSFGETPFKISIESPSAWKSPWFTDPLLSSPRYEKELTYEVYTLCVLLSD